jgi:hypothetical protein
MTILIAFCCINNKLFYFLLYHRRSAYSGDVRIEI